MGKAWSSIGFIVCCLLFVPGCAPAKVVVEGQLQYDGKPYQVEKGEEIEVELVDLQGEGTPLVKNYQAKLNRQGAFKVALRDGSGIPPGKYRLTVVSTSKRIGNTFLPGVSPLLLDIDGRTSRNVMVDLKTAKS